MLSHAEGNERHGYLWTLTSMFRLVCTMANEAELASVFVCRLFVEACHRHDKGLSDTK